MNVIRRTRTLKSCRDALQPVLAGVLCLLTIACGSTQLHAQNAAQGRALGKILHPEAGEANDVEATSVPLLIPAALAYDSVGDLFIASVNDHVIRMVDLHGLITTVAGTGEQGFAGDGGPATAAILDSPAGIAVDSSGNLFIADTHNQRIREVFAATGLINTIAGTGVAGFSGDGSVAAAANLNMPEAIGVDASGKVYFADTNNHRIRMISGTTIRTVAGDGNQTYAGDGVQATATGLDSPGGVAVDSSGELYIGDTHNHRIRVVNLTTGLISTVAGTGVRGYSGDGASGMLANLDRPRGLTLDTSGTLYFADSDNNRIRKVASGGISTIAGTGGQGFSGDTDPSTAGVLNTPRDVALFGTSTNASIAFTDTDNNRSREIDVSTGIITTIAGISPSTAEGLLVTGATSNVYGSGALTATFSNNGNTASGEIAFEEGMTTLVSGSLSGNIANVTLPLLPVGIHDLVATFAGDPVNPAITSGDYFVTITPDPILATAVGVSVTYGQPVPTVTGTLAGVLPVDAGNVTAVFSTAATLGSNAGMYPIAVTLNGSAAPNYSVSESPGAGVVTIVPAASATLLSISGPSSYQGVPVSLTATVSSAPGTPTGIVTFFNGGLSIGSAVLSQGKGTLSVTSLPAGTQLITAGYVGGGNYSASSSNTVSEVIAPDPDYTLAYTQSGFESVEPGSSVNFGFIVTPQAGVFAGPISFSVAGLPAGATASFTPETIPTLGSPTGMVMRIATTRLGAQLGHTAEARSILIAALLLVPLMAGRQRRVSGWLMGMLLLTMGGGATVLSGCSVGNGFFGQGPQDYILTVTSTGTNAAGAAVLRSANVTLRVQ